jgi:nucleoside-triphosphatase
MKVFITGRPGVGKTSVVKEVMDIAKRAGYKVGGVLCPELRVKGKRVGFEVVDIATNSRGILAHVKQSTGPQISRYKVNLEDLNRVGVKAILKALEEADLVIIDEVGPMELFSAEFRKAVIEAVKSPKPVLGVVHWKSRHPLVGFLRKEVKILEVTPDNRGRLGRRIAEELVKTG